MNDFNIENIKVIYSNRKTFGLEIKPNEEIVARVPARAALCDIENFIHKHQRWIENHLKKVRAVNESAATASQITIDDIKKLADKAVEYIPERVKYYADIIGTDYGQITIRAQKTRWGSCTAKGNLNFNCLLMLTPPEVIDSVIVHELCHRLEMNHSKRFYTAVYKFCPDYDRCNAWLKSHGAELMRRAFNT